MTNAFAIRPARSTDTAAISPLLRQLGYDQSPATLAKRIADDPRGHLAFVAETEGNIVGFMSLHIIEWFHRSDAVARLGAVVVDARCRRKGIGRALVKFAEATASRLGCSYIELTSNLRRKADGTYDFYDVLGYNRAQDTTYFRKRLGDISA